MGALNYNLAMIMRLSPEALADLQPDAAALAMIADTIHIPALVDNALAEPEVLDDIREALELITVRNLTHTDI